MLNLKREYAIYNESDLGRFNPDGLQRVKAAVELAGMRRTLGMTLADLEAANQAMALALEVKHSEQRLAMERFERERQACYDAIQAVATDVAHRELDDDQRRQVDNRLGHLATLFGLKDFARAQRECAELDSALQAAEAARRRTPPPVTAGIVGDSASSYFYRGAALERAGRRPEAVAAYEQALGRDPRHLQAKIALGRLVAATPAPISRSVH